MSLKVLLVGGGLTSSLISSLLKKAPAALEVWDKARGAGKILFSTIKSN
jgi:hypothetical protein